MPTPTFNPELQALLDTCIDKQSWSSTIVTALGDTRRLRCKRDDDAGAADAWSTGTEFLNVGLTDPMQLASGNITYFGRAFDTTVRLAADLATGTSVLRIEGNGNWMQGTLGLVGSGKDFMMPSNPTATSGVGFDSSATVRAPNLLPSGTGPGVPALTESAPFYIVLEDWTDPVNPVVVNTIAFNNRVDNLVFEDAEIAAEMGDIGVYQSTSSIIYGAFEFGAQLYVSSPTNTESGTEPLYQVLVGCKPFSTWLTYPAMDTYGRDANTTFPNPFKIHIRSLDGTILYTHQMRDGLPINSPELSQAWTEEKPIRPHFNCGMMLPWENTRTRRSGKAGKFFNGVTADSIRPSAAKAGDSCLAVFPMVSSYDSFNSLYHIYGIPRWAMRRDFEYGDSAETQALDPGPADPYLFNKATYHNYGGKQVRMVGWDYEPGSPSGHDWYTGPGGPRFDRAVAPTVLTLWATDQNFVRLEGNVPIRDMVDAWGKAYFNHSNHYITNVKTFGTVPEADILAGTWVHASAYYGGGPYSNGPGKTIDLVTAGASGQITDLQRDASGRLPWCGWGMDSLHSYGQPGWWALMLNSPMHAIACKFRFNAQWIGSLGAASASADPKGFFMVRVQAWRYLHYVMAWKLATSHSLGYSRAQIETRMQTELEVLHDMIYVPAFVDNSPLPYFASIRNLGTPATVSTSSYDKLVPPGGTLAYYMGHVLALMKQTGMWDAMRARSSKCSVALDMLIQCLDKYCFDFILDTDGRVEGYQNISGTKTQSYVFTAADIPADWAAWSAANPAVGQEDWIRDSAGVILPNSYEKDVGMHLRAQYAFMRRDYFSEIPHPRMADACAKYQSYYDVITTRVNAAATPTDKRSNDWHYRCPPLGMLQTPTEI